MSRKSGWVISQNTNQFSKYRPQYRPFWAFFPKKSVLQTKSFFTDRVVNTEGGLYHQGDLSCMSELHLTNDYSESYSDEISFLAIVWSRDGDASKVI